MVRIAELPLHGGKVPIWMLRYMERLGASVISAFVELRGPDALLSALSDPAWLQAYAAVIGMDWDSSGATVVALWTLKKASLERPELGFLVLGGKGRAMLEIPEEAGLAETRLGLDAELLRRRSKLAARLDGVFLQDGYELYVHSLIVSESGKTVAVQQGMSPEEGLARRYHIDKFEVEEPHSGVAGAPKSEVLDATASESSEARRTYLDVIAEGPRRFSRLLAEATASLRGQATLIRAPRSTSSDVAPIGERIPEVYRPTKPSKRLEEAVKRLAEVRPRTDLELALAPGLGPALLRALALISHLIYRVPTSTRDPVTHLLSPYVYGYAVGGKDGVPYRFRPKLAEAVAATLEDAVDRAKLGDAEKLKALARLRRLVERL